MVVAPSPIVALNRAVAVAERDGPEAGLEVMDELSTSTATTCSTPRGPTCCGAWTGSTRRRTPTGPRWR